MFTFSCCVLQGAQKEKECDSNDAPQSVSLPSDDDEDVDPAVVESQQCDISDDEEGDAIPENERVFSYFFEDDDEIEEYMRHMQVAGDSHDNRKRTSTKSKKQALVKCNKCSKTYKTINTYLSHRASHVMSGKRNILDPFSSSVFAS